MRFGLLFVLAVVTAVHGQGLPDLGGSGDAGLAPQTERRIGESIMRDIRFRDPNYLDDPEIADYLGNLGARLAQHAAGARQDFEFFAMRDHTINAFALLAALSACTQVFLPPPTASPRWHRCLRMKLPM